MVLSRPACSRSGRTSSSQSRSSAAAALLRIATCCSDARWIAYFANRGTALTASVRSIRLASLVAAKVRRLVRWLTYRLGRQVCLCRLHWLR